MIKLKIGIVGTGVIAREHAQAIAMLPTSAALVAVADVLPERLTAFADTFDVVRRYRTAGELIDDPGVNLVAVATPPSAHEDVVVAALDAGKYVLCEKPLAHSLASAERIAAAGARHPGRLSVNHQLRYDPHYRRLLWLVENGWIGEPQEVRVERHGYISQSTYMMGGAWWGAWDVAGGGVLMTQLIHELDIMLLAMGEPQSVSAKMDTRYTDIQSEDWIEGRISFSGGRRADFSASVNSGQMSAGLTIRGSLGSITPQGLQLADPLRETRALAAVDAALPDTRRALASSSLPARAVRKMLRKLSGGDKPVLTPHALLYSEIVAAVFEGRPLPIPPAEAMRPMQLVSGAYEAAITGRETGLPLGREARVHGGVNPADYAKCRLAKPTVRINRTLPKSDLVRIGFVGLDTSHATTFAELLHNPYSPDHVPGAKVSAAFAGGSLDMAISASRVGGFTAELRDKYGVPILESPEAVADAADVVFILSSDGRSHPGLFRSVAGRGRPVFIDKPFAISTADARSIFALAEETGTRVFASSAFRYVDGLVAALNEIRSSGETVKGCTVRYWGQIQPTQGRFFWYGIHGAEILVAVMGKGVKAAAAHTEGARDIIEVEHDDGRRSTMIGDHNDGTFHVTITTDRRTLEVPAAGAVAPRILVAALDRLMSASFPRLWRASQVGSISGRPSKLLDPDEPETMAVIALLEAAQRSHAGGNQWIGL